MVNTYVPPKILREWVNDVPNGELYNLYVFDDGRVCSAVGRFAHSSGSTTCSWSDFLTGSLNDLVQRTVGSNALAEARAFVAVLTK